MAWGGDAAPLTQSLGMKCYRATSKIKVIMFSGAIKIRLLGKDISFSSTGGITLSFFGIGFLASLIYPGYATDWRYVFYRAAHVPLSPYSVRAFVSPPWVAGLLYPFSYLSERLSLAVNAGMNMGVFAFLVLSRGGNLFSIVMALTSLPFLSLLANGNIDWIPALGFVLQNEWGTLFLLSKPQGGFLAAYAWGREQGKLVKSLLLATIFVGMSFLVWGNWIEKASYNLSEVIKSHGAVDVGSIPWNMSLFPWSIPIGIALVAYTLWYKPESDFINEEIVLTISTLCFVPYFAPHTLAILFALISASYRKAGVLFWLLLWLYPVLH